MVLVTVQKVGESFSNSFPFHPICALASQYKHRGERRAQLTPTPPRKKEKEGAHAESTQPLVPFPELFIHLGLVQWETCKTEPYFFIPRFHFLFKTLLVTRTQSVSRLELILFLPPSRFFFFKLQPRDTRLPLSCLQTGRGDSDHS